MAMYRVLVGVRFTNVYDIEASSDAEAEEIAEAMMMEDSSLDALDGSGWKFAEDDYNAWEDGM